MYGKAFKLLFCWFQWPCISEEKEVFPNVQREPLFQFVPVASGPVSGHHWKGPGSALSVTSLWVFVYIGVNIPIFKAEYFHMPLFCSRIL